MNVILLIVKIAAVIGMFFLFVWLLKWLWNITMTVIFNLKAITYWQAFRLLLIAMILFGRPQAKLGKRAIQEKVPAQELLETFK
ncbi:hypothetical protein KKC91_09030 [bacterium]|nr:hypothetical protein [bacterium]